MNSSPTRGTFHSQCKIDDAIEAGRDPNTDQDVLEAVEMDKTWMEHVKQREARPEWKELNLEYDLRSTEWICNKAKASEAYAQNLYAAMCNNEFQKMETWPLLKDQRYSCSWRYAGGIVADMVEAGDYIDWYCSGINGGASEEELAAMTEEERVKYQWYQDNFVGESFVTDEIREDLLKLGWKVLEDKDEDEN